MPIDAPTGRAPDRESVADYEVHEWGLVRQEAGADAFRFGGVAPAVAQRPMVMLKPVLYFHAASPMTLASVSVTAPAGSSILEVWPLLANGRLGARIGRRVEWTNITLGAAGDCAASALPAVGDPPCAALGGDFCEVASLAEARTTDGACVTANATTDRFLFYRGTTTSLRPPLTLARRADGGVSITNRGTTKIPGRTVLIHTEPERTVATTFDAPPPGASADVPDPMAALRLKGPVATVSPPVEAAQAEIRASMTALGMSKEEIAAFERAWNATLFPMQGPTVELDLAEVARPSDSILYFLPEEMTNDVATLGFVPSPRAVRRAIAVWIGIP